MHPASQRRLLYGKIKNSRILSWVECVFLVLCFAALVRARCGSGGSCYRGDCVNDTCVCHEGWQGPECQHCGGKVRITEPSGWISDGPGNYTVGVKCSWLLEPPAEDRVPWLRIRLESFATECGWDHLYVYDGDSVRHKLLGVFSGVVTEEWSLWTRQLIARSGRALLHFFSDDAYSMAGFNVSYAAYACLSDSAATNCSEHGICEDGVCTCDPGWLGSACDRPLCPDNCGVERGWGQCRSSGCQCSRGRSGDDCSQSTTQVGYQWLWREPGEDKTQRDGEVPAGVAGHQLVNWRGSLLRVGGESYGAAAFLYQYQLQEERWEEIVAAGGGESAWDAPAPRFAHSAVVLRDLLIVYGGRVTRDSFEFGSGIAGREGLGSDVTNELWVMDLTTRIWTNVTPVDCPRHQAAPMGHCGGLAVAGHTSVIVELGRPARSVMLTFFGHSPHYGYLNIVQEYWIDEGYWTAPVTHGWPARGGFGHSSAWDPLSRQVYIHGGLLSESEANHIPSGALYAYQPNTRVWTLLTSAQPKYLHTATFITPGIMLVFGGNVHNDTSSPGSEHRCRSGGAWLYDVRCDAWYPAPAPPAPRAAHAAAPLHRPNRQPAVIILGGFDGRLRSDALVVSAGWQTGGCGAHVTPASCVAAASKAALKCVWRDNICLHITEIGWIEQSSNSSSQVISCSDSDIATRAKVEARCTPGLSCGACTAAGCVWCGACHATSARCHTHREVAARVSECSEPGEEAVSACARLHSCTACYQHAITHHSGSSAGIARGCHWDVAHAKCRAGNASEEARAACPPACSALPGCANCTAEECIWCASAGRCVDKNAYSASFPLGGCRAWSTAGGEVSGAGGAWCARAACAALASCARCRAEPACGWCDDGEGGGRGSCVAGGARGPHAPQMCPADRWHFTDCPACQCNGHSVCAAEGGAGSARCIQPCGGRAIGDNCESCAPGHWGSPLNGGVCQACECNAQASACAADTGRCFCSTKGLAGDRCDKCDATNHYHPDPLNKAACYYDLAVDYQFTFNLSKKEDRHLSAINFRNSPVKPDVDADFSIACSAHARMNLTVRTHAQPGERVLFHDVNCSNFRYRFAKSEHTFGVEDNVTLTTFFVYVYDFRPPLWIQISFSQYPKLNLQQFFITFSSCFLLLLLVAAAMWKIKQKYDMYRRRQRLFVEMEQMASRPFSQVCVELETPASLACGAPSPVSLEPCRGGRAAVLSLLVRLPTGGTGRAPPLGGLAVASALVTLGHAPRDPRDARKQSDQHARAPAVL